MKVIKSVIPLIALLLILSGIAYGQQLHPQDIATQSRMLGRCDK
jgi:hypothetical protein